MGETAGGGLLSREKDERDKERIWGKKTGTKSHFEGHLEADYCGSFLIL